MKKSKKVTKKNNFYLSILNILKDSTNLTKIQESLNISKQNLNYYLRQLKKKGFIYSKATGWYELTEKGKNPTKYGIFLEKDMIRGHAYIWETEIEKIPENWDSRIEILEKRNINYRLVGALKTTPRIKVLGRKVWLCNNNLRIFDIEKKSYYGNNAKESRKISKLEAMKIVRACEGKLGIKLNPNKIKFRKEHYALIKNDLAIEHNQKGEILRISDEEGEWLLIDDSLGEGGELENIGKKAFKTNPKLQNWWNQKKKNNFKIDDNYIEKNIEQGNERIRKISEQNIMLSQIIEQLSNNVIKLTKEVWEIKNGKN